jgi:hypothetical protein
MKGEGRVGKVSSESCIAEPPSHSVPPLAPRSSSSELTKIAKGLSITLSNPLASPSPSPSSCCPAPDAVGVNRLAGGERLERERRGEVDPCLAADRAEEEEEEGLPEVREASWERA